MKRILLFTKEDDLKFKAVVDYLFDSSVAFKATYEVDGKSMVEFECSDAFYEVMLEEVPRIYRNKD